MKRLLHEVSGYAAASAGALFVDMLTLWLAVHFLSLNYIFAATLSFLCGALVAYWLSIKIAFRERRVTDRRIEVVCFVGIGTVGACINACVIYIGVQFFGMHYLLAKCIAAGFTFSFNFLARRQMLFVARHASEAST